jgi:flotillin
VNEYYQPTGNEVDPTWWVVLIAIGAAFLIMLLIFAFRHYIRIAVPNTALVFSGPQYKLPDGTKRGYMVLQQGLRKFQWPILEKVDLMDMRLIPIDVRVENAYSRGNIPLQVRAIANVKINSDARYIGDAIERFLGRSTQEVATVAQQTLEGTLREVVATLTPEQVNTDRLTFAERLAENAEEDLQKLGLHLDTLKIQHVHDDVGYLDSLGRPRIAAALRDAENAENQANQQTVQAQADSDRRAQVAKADSEKEILQKVNELRETKAKLEGYAQSVEREAEAAAKTARATAEQELQGVRASLEHKRLEADVIIPAEAKREAKAILAVGEAAPTAENGSAQVQVLQMMTEAWKAMGPQAREIYVIQHLEDIVGTVVKNLDSVNVGEVHVLDQGDGSALSSYAATYPQMVARVLAELSSSTGVNVPEILNRSNGGN